MFKRYMHHLCNLTTAVISHIRSNKISSNQFFPPLLVCSRHRSTPPGVALKEKEIKTPKVIFTHCFATKYSAEVNIVLWLSSFLQLKCWISWACDHRRHTHISNCRHSMTRSKGEGKRFWGTHLSQLILISKINQWV